METLLSSQLGGYLILALQTEPGDRPAKPSTGSAKAEPLVSVSGTAWGRMPGFCMWLLGSGKRFILLTRMEYKEVAQSWGSAWRAPRPPPPQKQGRAHAPGGSLELLAPPAGWWVRSSVRRWVRRSRCGFSRVLGRPSAAEPPLTAAYAPPAGAAGRGLRCARS